MNIPGFSAETSVYRSPGQYRVFGRHNDQAHGRRIVPQLAIGLSPSDLYLCRLFCAYCRYVGLGCFACWYCAIIISMGGVQAIE